MAPEKSGAICLSVTKILNFIHALEAIKPLNLLTSHLGALGSEHETCADPLHFLCFIGWLRFG